MRRVVLSLVLLLGILFVFRGGIIRALVIPRKVHEPWVVPLATHRAFPRIQEFTPELRSRLPDSNMPPEVKEANAQKLRLLDIYHSKTGRAGLRVKRDGQQWLLVENGKAVLVDDREIAGFITGPNVAVYQVSDITVGYFKEGKFINGLPEAPEFVDAFKLSGDFKRPKYFW